MLFRTGRIAIAISELSTKSRLGALADSGDELAKKLARICQLAQETDAKLTNWWLRQINPKTRNGIACEPVEAQPTAASGSNVESSDADEVRHYDNGQWGATLAYG